MHELLSYNTQYGKRLDEINGWVERLPQQPDIICYQEYPEDKVDNANPLKSSGYKYELD